MAKLIKHPTLEGVTSETHPNLYNEADKTWHTPETMPKAFYPNGKPRAFKSKEQRKAEYDARVEANGGPIVKRTDAESLIYWQGKRVVVLERHAAELAKIDAKITYFSTPRTKRNAVDPEAANAAYKQLAAQGLTPEQIVQFAETARLASAALKGKTPEELAALAGPPPAFFNVAQPVG